MKKIVTILLGLLLCLACFVGRGEGGGEQQPSGGNQGETSGGSQGEISGGEQGEPSGGQTGEEPETPAWKEDGVLKILMIGNSFSDDTIEHVYGIAHSLGIEQVKLGNLYIGACTIETHYNCATNALPAYTYFTNTDGTWHREEDYVMGDAIMEESDWDFISLQQAGANGAYTIPETFEKLPGLISYVRELVGDKPKLVWNMGWAWSKTSPSPLFQSLFGGDQMKMYEKIVSVLESEVLSTNAFEKVIPTGTAFQNIRTSSNGETGLYRGADEGHFSLGFGRYLAGLTLVTALTDIELTDDVWAPSGVTEDQKVLCLEAAKNAAKTPFAVTQSEYKE